MKALPFLPPLMPKIAIQLKPGKFPPNWPERIRLPILIAELQAKRKKKMCLENCALHCGFIIGTTQAIAIMENIMEHLAKVRKEDSLQFRLKNMNPENNEVGSLKNIIDQVLQTSQYKERRNQVIISCSPNNL